ncbi:MAG: heavy metal-responsive transcriptional regulator [Pseudomonadota bacterium]
MVPLAKAQSIGRLSREIGVGIDTIRFYERIGLLPAPQRTAAGYRMYADADRQRLSFIRRAQDLGFSLQEISILLQLSKTGGSVAKAKALAIEKLSAVREKLTELERLRAVLESLVDRCPGSGDPAHCPIISALNAPPSAQKVTPRSIRKARSS